MENSRFMMIFKKECEKIKWNRTENKRMIL